MLAKSQRAALLNYGPIRGHRGATFEEARHRHHHRRCRADRLCARISRRLGTDARERPAGQPATARDHAGAALAHGRRDGTRRLRLPDAQPDRRDRRRQGGIQGLRLRDAGRCAPARSRHGAEGPVARERADLLGPGPRNERVREPRRARAGRRQSREHQRAHRGVERTRHRAAELHRDDAARPQPRARPARREDRHSTRRRSAA